MPGCIVSAMTASFRSVEKRRRRATPVITSTFENVSDIGVCLGLYLGPPAKAGVRSKRGAVQYLTVAGFPHNLRPMRPLPLAVTTVACHSGEMYDTGVARVGSKRIKSRSRVAPLTGEPETL